MQKKIEAELISLAHQILKLKNNSDVNVLKEKAKEVYEKASVLAFITKYAQETPTEKRSIDEITQEVFEEKEPTKEEVKVEEVVAKEKKSKKNQIKEVVEERKEDQSVGYISEFEDFKESVSLDVASDLFENAARVESPKTVNDIVNHKNLQIDLNDRIAFVKHLFKGNQEDFNRVISQLNTMISEKEAKAFLGMVKKDYNWSEKENYEERLLILIERKFL